MKKILFTLLITISTFTVFAQSVSFGVKGGLNLSNQSFDWTYLNLDSKNLVGFHIGVISEIGFGNISLQPGIFFSTKGYKYFATLTNQNQQSSNATFKTTLNYIDIPVNIFYNIKASPGVIIYLGGGPYVAYGTSGSFSGEGKKTDLPFDQNDAGDGYKNPDYGINFVAGIKLLKKITFDVDYGLGLGDVAYTKGVTVKNRVISLSVGYMFK